jgi:hypothetical protein
VQCYWSYVEWLQIYIPNEKHVLSSSQRKEAILGVVGTSASDLFDYDMPLDNHFSVMPSLLWCALLFSVCGSNTMLKAHRDVRVNTSPERNCFERNLHSLLYNCGFLYHCATNDTRCNRSTVLETNCFYGTSV